MELALWHKFWTIQICALGAVPPMDEPHALALLEKKLKTQCSSDGVRELAAALEFMPLAIV